MAELNLPMNRPVGRRMTSAAVNAPRLVMSWEDWLTLVAAIVAFVAIAVSIQQAEWVERMPPLVPTAMAGLVIGLFAARVHVPIFVSWPAALLLGAVVVVLAAQQYADGLTLSERLEDFRVRMEEWWHVVRAGDISNDNLPFVTLVQAVTFLAAFLASWSIYRWQNAWLAVIPGGIVLLANISFLKGQPSAAFIVFLFGAIVLIARLHLQKSQLRWKRQGVEYPEFISLNATQMTVVLTTVLIVAAWLVPLGKQQQAVEGVFDSVVSPVTNRSDSLVRLFHNVDSRKGAELHTFGATLPIQGNVKLGTKILFEVQSGEPGVVRATSYDEYTGNGWKATDRDTARVEGSELVDPEAAEGYAQRTVTILRVTVVDPESTVLTLGTPVLTTLDALVDTPDGFAGDIERIRSRRGLEKGDTYNAFGSTSRATAEQLAAAGSQYPDWVRERYLQLPKDLPPRVRAETERIIREAGATNPYEAAVAVQDYLRTFPYDLTVEAAPPGHDVTDYLLFELRRGYFDFQATAMAVMLRTIGIPARVAVGYLLDPAEANETTYTIRKDDAYSWVEVFFPGYGWVTFNPTQDRPPGGAGGIGSTTENSPVIDLETIPEIIGSGGLGIEPNEVTDALNEPPVLANDGRTIPWPLIYALLGVLGAAAVIAGGGHLAWNWGLGSLDGRARMWAKVQRLSRFVGMAPRPEETAREWSARVGSAVDREAEARTLAMAYEETKYGRPDLQRIDDADAEGAYKRLRQRLTGVLLRRNRPVREE